MKFLAVLGVGFQAFLAPFPGAKAEDIPIHIAAREFLPPYVYEGAKSGIEIDLIRAIVARMGRTVEFAQLPRVRMIQSFEDGKLDGIITQNASASSIGCATKPYIEHMNMAFSLTERHLAVDSLQDLSAYTVLSFSGARRYLGPEFSEAVSHVRRYTESGDQETHISLLYKKRFDLVVGDQWILSLAQKRHFEKTGEFEALTRHSILPPTHYVARFHDPALCESFNGALDTLTTNGALAAIWASYQANLLVSTQ